MQNHILKLKIFKTIWILIFSLIGINSIFAEPVISLSKTSFEFGDIREGKVEEASFIIRNKGDRDLFVEAGVSCGCVRILGEKKFRILPGEKKKINFSFNSTGYEGKITHYIYINSNDPENRFLKIPVSSFVIRSPKDVLERFSTFNLGIIISAGLIDGINPCAFTVLVFFISFLTFVGYTKKKMLIAGLTFILSVFITYILIGFGLFEFIRRLELFFIFSQWTGIVVSILAFILGAISLYDFFIYKKTKDFEKIRLKLPLFLKEKIQETIRQKTDIRRYKFLAKDLKLFVSVFTTGFIVSLLESICTGQIYIPTIVYILKISPFRLSALGYLLLYNLMFIFPLIFIFYLGIRGLTSESFGNFARKNLAKVKFITAVIFFILGIGILATTKPVFPKPSKISLIIITPKDCLTCNTKGFTENLKKILTDLEIKELDFEDKIAKEIMSDLKINMLPAYFLDKRIKERKEYQKLESFLIDTKKDYFYFDPSFTGISYFVGRKRIPGRLDLFISTEVIGLDKILEMIKDLTKEEVNIHLHFLAQEKEIEGFVSGGGIFEIEEYLRSVCIEKYNKEKLFDYLICRAKNIKSSWWQDCAQNLDLERITLCAKSEEGKDLLRKNIRLVQELSISQAPLVLLFNQEIFGITKDTSAKELKEIIKKE